MNKPRVSVVMTTYNGEQFIKKQLDSIKKQTWMPDEVIIIDDCSEDSTYKVIKDFIDKKEMPNWRVIVNENNIGWRANFYKASKMATGDIIFFSDQDDIWHADKIEYMTSWFIKKRMDGLFAEKNIIDKNGELNNTRVEKEKYTGELNKIDLRQWFYSIKTLGCCECVSRKVLDKYIEINMPECGHDSQCGRLALLYDNLWHLDKPVIDYRIHDTNSSGISEKGSFGRASREQRTKDLVDTRKWLKYLQDDIDFTARRNQIQRAMTVLNTRIAYLKPGSRILWFKLLKYYDAYPNMTSLIGDFAYKHSLNIWLGSVRWWAKKHFGK